MEEQHGHLRKDRQRDRETDRQKGRETERHRDRETERQRDKATQGQGQRQTNSAADLPRATTHRQTDRTGQDRT